MQSCSRLLTCFIIDRTLIHNASALRCSWMKHKKRKKISLSRLKAKGRMLLAFIHLTNTDHGANAPFVLAG